MKQNDQDIFDRIMSLKIFAKLYPFYQKYKAVLLYIFFGGLTTVVSIGSFYICNTLFAINELLSNAVSWILAVLFAYVTNRIWVFNSNATGKAIVKEIFAFFSGRFTTFLVEEVILFIFITLLSFNGLVVKTAAQVFVLVSNYFISKILVFSEKKNGKN